MFREYGAVLFAQFRAGVFVIVKILDADEDDCIDADDEE
jgi:hypothetical protein